MKNNLESGISNPESNEKGRFHLRINLIRHAEKAGGNDVTSEEDMAMRLTPKGRLQARERGQEFNTEGGVASGSTRLRTRETAMHMAQAQNLDMTGEETYEEMLEHISEPWTNTRLDMPFDKDHEEFDVINEHYDKGVILKYYLDTDKAAVKEGGDRSATVYGTQVRNIASIIERFARIAGKMADRAAHQSDTESSREQNMVTHGGVAESFYAEVIRRTLGEEELNKYLTALPNGMSVTQGSQIDIDAASGEEPSFNLKFKLGKPGSEYVFNQVVPLTVVQDIVKDFSPA